jgi:superfamily II helicase
VVVVDELHMVQDDHRGGTLVCRPRIMPVPATSFKHIVIRTLVR